MLKYILYKAIRQIYSRYWEPRKEALKKATVKVPLTKKDGSESKRYLVFYKCSDCGKDYKKVHVHHNPPIGTIPDWPPKKKGDFESWMHRLFCEEGLLVVLCEKCHQRRHKK